MAEQEQDSSLRVITEDIIKPKPKPINLKTLKTMAKVKPMGLIESMSGKISYKLKVES